MSTIQPLTRDELAQIRQWYADEVRNLPRKVVRDVAALLDHIACQRADVLAADGRLADLDELRHAVGHALDCDRGTVLCADCTRLLRRAMRRP